MIKRVISFPIIFMIKNCKFCLCKTPNPSFFFFFWQGQTLFHLTKSNEIHNWEEAKNVSKKIHLLLQKNPIIPTPKVPFSYNINWVFSFLYLYFIKCLNTHYFVFQELCNFQLKIQSFCLVCIMYVYILVIFSESFNLFCVYMYIFVIFN